MIQIAFLEPKVEGNIGAIARSMANFNLKELILINPQCDPKSEEVMKRAKHAKQIIENAKIVLNVLSGKDRSSRKDLIIVNAAAILYLGDVAASFKEGYEIASNSIENGEAIKKVEELVKCSHGNLKSFRNLLN